METSWTPFSIPWQINAECQGFANKTLADELRANFPSVKTINFVSPDLKTRYTLRKPSAMAEFLLDRGFSILSNGKIISVY